MKFKPIAFRSAYILIRTSFEGFHRWPDAPNEAAWLRESHRHIFHVELHVPVMHDGRDIEFILAKRELDAFLVQFAAMLDTESCESIAASIIHFASHRWPRVGMYACEVSEDGENGALVCADLDAELDTTEAPS